MSMLRHAWKPILAVAAVGTPSYLYYNSRYAKDTFDLPVKTRGADGKTEMTTRTIPLLSLKTLEARIREFATFNSVTRPDGITWKHTTACLASNDPIEDANASQIVARDKSDPSAPGDYLFFTVMDGHGGYQTSQLLSRVLINAVALELSSLVTTPSTSSDSYFARLKSGLWPASPPPAAASPGSDPQRVSTAIQDAFTKLDNELISAPLRVLASNIDEEARKNKVLPDLSQHPLALTTMLPAVSGSCALMAIFDTAHRNLYVACTGDSRAVAGVWERTSDGKGVWKVEVLSEDQTGRNPDELKRVQSEHPADEADHVIREGRILGGLEPSRAFGDARYKWPRAIQESLSQVFMAGNGKPMRLPPTSFKTPPYVTARPVVTHRKLSFSPTPEGSSDKNLRFLVLATDGLWDQLTSEEVVGLVGGHLAGLKGTIPKSQLPELIPTTTGSPTVDGKKSRSRDRPPHSERIRGGDEGKLRRLLSIPAPYSRRYRDDITVTVVWWEDGNESSAQITSFTDKIKSKL
ncbi:phosphatase 2C-like domain-containing protein [Infundibulicybe gibba]|nr:phosphatase 2C-like domain-containing protein [Infundibulicybe gibba]